MTDRRTNKSTDGPSDQIDIEYSYIFKTNNKNKQYICDIYMSTEWKVVGKVVKINAHHPSV